MLMVDPTMWMKCGPSCKYHKEITSKEAWPWRYTSGLFKSPEYYFKIILWHNSCDVDGYHACIRIQKHIQYSIFILTICQRVINGGTTQIMGIARMNVFEGDDEVKKAVSVGEPWPNWQIDLYQLLVHAMELIGRAIPMPQCPLFLRLANCESDKEKRNSCQAQKGYKLRGCLRSKHQQQKHKQRKPARGRGIFQKEITCVESTRAIQRR